MNTESNSDDRAIRSLMAEWFSDASAASPRKQIADDMSQLAIHEWNHAPTVTVHRHPKTYAFGFGSMASRRRIPGGRNGIAVGVTKRSDGVEIVTSVAVTLESPRHEWARQLVGERAWQVALELGVDDRETIDLGDQEAANLVDGWSALIDKIAAEADSSTRTASIPARPAGRR
jgi:hypothetical protein